MARLVAVHKVADGPLGQVGGRLVHLHRQRDGEQIALLRRQRTDDSSNHVRRLTIDQAPPGLYTKAWTIECSAALLHRLGMMNGSLVGAASSHLASAGRNTQGFSWQALTSPPSAVMKNLMMVSRWLAFEESAGYGSSPNAALAVHLHVADCHTCHRCHR